MNRRSIIILTALSMLWRFAFGQNPLQHTSPLSKHYVKTVEFAPDDVFTISGEKASIIIRGWDKAYAEIAITFSAEHPDKTVAAKEIEYMHYSLSRDGNAVELRNAFLLPTRTDHIESRIRVRMELTVPRSINITLYNKYGDIEVNNLTGAMSLTLDFSDLLLYNVSGKLNIRSAYSEVRGQGLSISAFSSIDEESKYRLSLDNGSYTFKSKHSDINLTIGTVKSLLVDAAHTEIVLYPRNSASYNYQLTSKEGKIFMPKQFGNIVKESDSQSTVLLKQEPDQPLLHVKTTFNTITIQ